MRRELVRGEVVEMPPASDQHAGEELRLMALLEVHILRHRLGKAYGSSVGYVVRHDPDTVLEPDGSFVVASRQPASYLGKFSRIIPDLVLEVVSPSDRDTDVADKIDEWLAAGVRVVLLLRPKQETLTIHRSRTDVTVLTRGDALTCEDLLPGFALPLSVVFDIYPEEGIPE
ncbi:MAG: Uma2 family endonuclease [Armatimonadetes bacterium]|nr:Uma2 family endonuclease [Armatimonadota bacterium]